MSRPVQPKRKLFQIRICLDCRIRIRSGQLCANCRVESYKILDKYHKKEQSEERIRKYVIRDYGATRSYPPSIMPALENYCRVWGLPR